MIEALQVFLLSMTPLGELRISIPIGIFIYGMKPLSVFLISILGNFIPAFLILICLKKVSEYLSSKFTFFHKIFSWWENNTKKNHLEKINSLGLMGLIMFVGIPLPMTGAWTGALLATLMNLPLKKSVPAILAGIIMAGIIVSTLILSGINIEKYFGWKTLLITLIIILLISLFIWIILNRKSKNKKNDKFSSI